MPSNHAIKICNPMGYIQSYTVENIQVIFGGLQYIENYDSDFVYYSAGIPGTTFIKHSIPDKANIIK